MVPWFLFIYKQIWLEIISRLHVPSTTTYEENVCILSKKANKSVSCYVEAGKETAGQWFRANLVQRKVC